MWGKARMQYLDVRSCDMQTVLYAGLNYYKSHMFWWTLDTWMLKVKPVYKLSNVSDDLKWTTNTYTYDTIFTNFQGITNNIYGFGRPFFAPSFFFARSLPIFLPVHIRFYPSN